MPTCLGSLRASLSVDWRKRHETPALAHATATMVAACAAPAEFSYLNGFRWTRVELNTYDTRIVSVDGARGGRTRSFSSTPVSGPSCSKRRRRLVSSGPSSARSWSTSSPACSTGSKPRGPTPCHRTGSRASTTLTGLPAASREATDCGAPRCALSARKKRGGETLRARLLRTDG